MKLFVVYIFSTLLLVEGQIPGMVWNFTQVFSSKDTIVLGWNFTPGDLTFKRHEIVKDNDPPLPNFCSLEYCEQEFRYMEICRTYNFTITPYFMDPVDSSLDFVGEAVSAVGRTADEMPGSPRNLEVTEQTDSGITIQWTEPSTFPECVDHYRVCATLENQQGECVETTHETYTGKLEFCAQYTVTVSCVTFSGIVGPAQMINFFTIESVPGTVVDLQVVTVGSNFINASFGRPLENPYCIEGYKYNIRPIVLTENDLLSKGKRGPRREECDPCYAVFYPLKPCTSYTLIVNAYNPSLVDGPSAETTAKTEEIPPMDPVSIVGTPLSPESIEVVWVGNTNDECAGDSELCWVDDIHPVETCMNYQQGAFGGSYIIQDLFPCSLYTISVVFKSPIGLESSALFNSTRTFDVEPNPVENLTITEVTVNTVTYMFRYPTEQEQCAASHEIVVENLEGRDYLPQDCDLEADSDDIVDDDPKFITETENGLDACTNYKIYVRTLSPTGLVSEHADIAFTTLEAQPGQPRGLDERYSDENSITFVFYQPEENPSCATSYNIKWDSSSADSGEKEHIPQNPLPFQMEEKITGLASCTEYVITVSAVGYITGESASSDPLILTTAGCIIA